MLLEDRFAEFLEILPGQSECNRRNYNQRLRGFLDAHGRRPAAAVTPADINAWQRDLLARKLAPATVAGYRQALKALFNYCVEVGDINRSPAAHLTIGSFATSRADRLPDEDAVRRVTDVALGWMKSESPQRARDALIWLLSVGSGPRLGELRNLRLDDAVVALRQGPDTYGVYRVPSAGKTGRVTIRFAGDAVEALERWLRLRPAGAAVECLTTTRPPCRALTRSAATKSYEHICAAAGVETPILSHALRHRLGDLTTRRYGPKVAAIILNHRDWQRAATAIAFYHHPDEADASLAVLSSRDDATADERAELHRLFGIPGRGTR